MQNGITRRAATIGAMSAASLLTNRQAGAQAATGAPHLTFNAYIRDAVDELANKRSNGGYDMRRNFTQDLLYGGGTIKSSRPLIKNPGPNPSMCVAAVAEVIIEAINIYHRDAATREPDQKPAPVYEMLRIGMWTGGTRLALRPYIWRYKEVYSPGAAYALELFGIGRQKAFSDLNPGDVVNINRANGTGHCVIFMNYLDARRESVSAYSNDVVGFRYFSAQGNGRPDGGFGYRYAFFSGKAPRPRRRDDDEFIMPLTTNQVLLNAGEMLHPRSWRVDQAIATLRSNVTRSLEDEAVTRGLDPSAFVPQELERELTEDPNVYIDGSEGAS
jgi:hypothetical protein